MAKLLKSGDFFAIDIGTNALRIAQLKPSLSGQSWDLTGYGFLPVDEKVLKTDNIESKKRFGELIMTVVGQSGIKTKDIVIGYPSNKTFTTVIDLPDMPENEIKNTIKYQIDQYIPMSVAETKFDYFVLGKSIKSPNEIEVLITSVSNAYTEDKNDFFENLGFNVIAAEPEGIAMLRSILPSDIKDARIVIDFGEQNTDLAITYGDTPRLVRNIPIGIRSLTKAISQNLSVQEDQARQFILKFGFAIDKLDGHVLSAVRPTIDNFVNEISKSIKFFQNRYPNISISGIILSGFTSTIPLFAQYITDKLSINCVMANPFQGINVPVDAQVKLAPVASEFSAVIGLAKRV